MIRAMAIFLAAAVTAYFFVLIAGASALGPLGIRDDAGGGTMAIAFFFAPIAAIGCGLACAWLLRRR